MNSEDTSGPEFWKSTRKILATSRSMYKKRGGDSADADWWKHMVQYSEDDADPPVKRASWAKGKERAAEDGRVAGKLRR